MGFFDFMTEDIAIDLGTANTLIIHNGKVVIDSPSIVARNRITGKIIAIGQEANLMQGKTHENIKTIRPLKDGVIADFDASEKMINMFIKSIPVSTSAHYDYRIRMINPLSFAEYQVEYFKNGSLVKRLQKNWHATGEVDRRALIWNFWTVLVFKQNKLVAQSVALLNDADYRWNQSLAPDLWSEARLRKIRR